VSTPITVANSSPLIAFERIEALDLLRQVVGSALIPPAVREEVFGDRDVPPWLEERTLTQPLASRILAIRLGAGEREAIALALEARAAYVLLDDLAARRLAVSLGLMVRGTAGLLLQAKAMGLVPAVGPLLVALRAHEFRISDRVLARILAAAREIRS